MEGEVWSIDSCGDSWAMRRGANLPCQFARGLPVVSELQMETEAAQPEEAGQYRVTAILISIH